MGVCRNGARHKQRHRFFQLTGFLSVHGYEHGFLQSPFLPRLDPAVTRGAAGGMCSAKTLAKGWQLLRSLMLSGRTALGRIGKRPHQLFPAYGVNTPYTTRPKLVKMARTTDPGSVGGESRGPYSERLIIKPLFLLGREMNTRIAFWRRSAILMLGIWNRFFHS